MGSSTASADVQSFNANGTYTVPAGARSAFVVVRGQAGANYNGAIGGAGAQVRARLPVTPGQQLDISVGGLGATDGCNKFTTTDGGWGGLTGAGGAGIAHGPWFYTGTSGDNLVHIVTKATTGFVDTTTPIAPKLPAADGTIVVPNLLVQRPRKQT